MYYSNSIPNFHIKLGEYVSKEGENKVQDFLIHYNLDFPQDEYCLIGSDGFISQLTNGQACELYTIIKDDFNDVMCEWYAPNWPDDYFVYLISWNI